MSEFPPDWYEWQRKQEAARSWAEETLDAPRAEWALEIESVLSSVGFVKADENHESKWAELRIDTHPSLAKGDAIIDEEKKYFNDDGLNEIYKLRMSDQRPKVACSISRSRGVASYSVSLETRDPEDSSIIVSTTYNWSSSLGYVVLSRSHVDDMLSSSGRNSTRDERRILPSDYLEIKLLLEILVESKEEDSITFNGIG